MRTLLSPFLRLYCVGDKSILRRVVYFPESCCCLRTAFEHVNVLLDVEVTSCLEAVCSCLHWGLCLRYARAQL